ISADNATHLLFTTENWAADHVVTLTSVDDNLSDGLQSFYVKLGADNSTSDLNYHGIDPQDVVVATVDDETAGFIITDVSGDTTESGGQAMFAMRLGSQPSSDVIVQFTSGDLSEAEVVTDNLTFDQSNWNGYQNVKVRGVDDNDTDGNITYPLEINVNSSSDSNFVGLDVPDVIFVNVDDETPGYTITSISGNTNEFGLKASFAIRLNTKPDNSSTPVQLAIRSSDTTEGIVSTTSVEFTDTNWNAYQYVTVTGIDDNVTDGNQGYFIEILPDNDTGDLNYLNKDPLDIYLVNLDNEQPGYIISSISGDTTEGGGEAVFSVRLMTQPDNSSTDVTLTFETSDSTEGTVSPNSVTFTYDNWKSYQNIKVTGVNDNISDGNQIFYVIINADNSTDDLNYRGFDPLDVPVVNVDDDIAGYFVSDISGDVYESGGNATFAIRLKTQPDNSSVNVTLSFSSSDTGEGTVSPDNLTFTYDDWNAYKNVTVYGVNDNLTDGNQTFSVIIEGDNQTLDSKYNSLDVDDIFVVNVDDDTPGFTITPISGPTSEDGGTATFTFKVNTVPDDLDSSTNNDNVTISISSSDTTEGTVYPSQLVFTKSNWNSENQITVTGVDDNVSDGNQSYSIILDVDNSTTAVGYSILNPSDVNLYNIDSDSPG
ncbi:MAG: Calx-beta domain-containing protein, partial [Deltaproteobacteria bacterium]